VTVQAFGAALLAVVLVALWMVRRDIPHWLDKVAEDIR
jgi:hypothetical protein